MVEGAEAAELRSGRLGLIWLCCLGILFVLSFVLGLFDTSTELPPTPLNDALTDLSFVIGIVLGLVSAGVTAWQFPGYAAWRRVIFAFAMGLFGLIGTTMTALSLAAILSGWVDFPAATTRSRPALLLVSRAYQTHGKGRSWNIQTQPVWSNIEISEADYAFMSAHRRPGDHGKDPDEISSRGYFCAKVTIQESETAVRVMHAGRQKLPEGSVIVCPPSARLPPS